MVAGYLLVSPYSSFTCHSLKSSTATRRQQDLGLGPAFDGTHGVDSEDITNIPQLDLSSFMLFPDQNNYGSQSLGMSARDVTASEGTEWINLQGDTSRT